jgi:hypothetical protein
MKGDLCPESSPPLPLVAGRVTLNDGMQESSA